MNKEEINDAVANGKYIANIYGEGSIGYYKVYSMIDVISELQKENQELEDINNKWKTTIAEYKKELEETKKHLNSNCNIALMDFGIDLINHILKGENQ